jgi:CDP-diacylglycerol---serine O-phosphatidyltransferase
MSEIQDVVADAAHETPEGPPRPRRKGIYILPNLFTLAALFGGFYAIVMAMNGRFEQAAIGVFCAMVLDSLDGRVARMTNTQSTFGEQMDSLSDMVSFGAAPARSSTSGP